MRTSDQALNSLGDLDWGDVVLGRCVIERRLRADALTSVHLARGREPGEMFTVWAAHSAPIARSERATLVFELELERLARLATPGIPPLIAFGVGETGPVVITARRPGSTLREIIASAPDRSLRLACTVLAGIERVLAELHAQRPPVLHRALTPDRIVLDEEGEVHVLECGFLHALVTAGFVTDRFVAASPQPGYRTPAEIAFPATPAVDAFALATLMFELLTGTLPFAEGSAIDLSRALREQALPIVSPYRDDLGASVDAVFRRAFGVARGEGYPTVQSFAYDLLQALNSEGTARPGPPDEGAPSFDLFGFPEPAPFAVTDTPPALSAQAPDPEVSEVENPTPVPAPLVTPRDDVEPEELPTEFLQVLESASHAAAPLRDDAAAATPGGLATDDDGSAVAPPAHVARRSLPPPPPPPRDSGPPAMPAENASTPEPRDVPETVTPPEGPTPEPAPRAALPHDAPDPSTVASSLAPATLDAARVFAQATRRMAVAAALIAVCLTVCVTTGLVYISRASESLSAALRATATLRATAVPTCPVESRVVRVQVVDASTAVLVEPPASSDAGVEAGAAPDGDGDASVAAMIATTSDVPAESDRPSPREPDRHPRHEVYVRLLTFLRNRVRACVEGVEGTDGQTVTIIPRFSGATGQVVHVHVRGMFAAPPMGPCLEEAVRRFRVAPFPDPIWEPSLIFLRPMNPSP